MAEHTPRPIRHSVPTTAADTGAPVPAQLCWTPGLPCEVRVELLDRRAGVWQPWRMARELLDGGLVMPTGDGDAHAEPFPGIPGIGDDLLLTLGHPSSTPRTAWFLLHGETVAGFLADTYQQVPVEREHVEIPDFYTPGASDG